MFHVERNYIFPMMKFHRRIKYSLIISRLRIIYLSTNEPCGAIFDKKFATDGESLKIPIIENVTIMSSAPIANAKIVPKILSTVLIPGKETNFIIMRLSTLIMSPSAMVKTIYIKNLKMYFWMGKIL